MTNRRWALVGLLAAAVVTVAMALAWNPAQMATQDSRTGVDVLVLGIDGLDWVLVGRYIEEGALPSMARLVRAGISGEIEAEAPVDERAAWEAVGHGRTAGAWIEGDPGDGYGVVPEVLRLADAAGATALSVSWPSTWPAADPDLAVVAAYEPASDEHPMTLTPTLFADAPGQAASPRLSALIREAVARNEDSLDGDFGEAIYDGPAADGAGRERIAAARWAFLSDRITLDIAARLLAEEEPELALVCLRGLDAVTHRFLAEAAPEAFAGRPQRASEHSEVLKAYYRFVDRAVGRLVRLIDERTLILVCSPYGTHPSTACPPASAGHERGAPGVLLARGPRITRGGEPARLRAVDLAPTILAALEVVIPADMEGRACAALVPQGLSAERDETPPRRWPPQVERATPSDVATMERLVEERRRAVSPGP